MAAVWLGVVVLLILAVSRAARWVPALRRSAGPDGALVLLGSLALDGRRRVHLVQAGASHALLLTGGGTDVVLGLPPAPHA
jgi:hypothetical protein